MEVQVHHMHLKVAALLARAASESRKTHSELARATGLKRDTVRRTLAGERAASLPDAILLLDATGFAGEETLLFMLLAGEDFAVERAGTEVAQFLGELFRRTPRELVAELGEDVCELRPRWAIGTAKMLARTLSQHVAELNRRGDAIGER